MYNQLLVDARHGSERSRCNRLGCSSWYLARILDVIYLLEIKKGVSFETPFFIPNRQVELHEGDKLLYISEKKDT